MAHTSKHPSPTGCTADQGRTCPYRCRSNSPCPPQNWVANNHMSKALNSFQVTNTAVREKYENRCGNCGAQGNQVTLDVHHIVPRGQGGSNLMGNQILLCRPCHDAAHGKRMAPTVQSMSTGSMGAETFELYRRFWSEILPAIGDICNVPIEPIFVEDDNCWHVAEADMRMLMGMVESRI